MYYWYYHLKINYLLWFGNLVGGFLEVCILNENSVLPVLSFLTTFSPSDQSMDQSMNKERKSSSNIHRKASFFKYFIFQILFVMQNSLSFNLIYWTLYLKE